MKSHLSIRKNELDLHISIQNDSKIDFNKNKVKKSMDMKKIPFFKDNHKNKLFYLIANLINDRDQSYAILRMERLKSFKHTLHGTPQHIYNSRGNYPNCIQQEVENLKRQ